MGTRGEAIAGAVLLALAVAYLAEALRLPRPRYAVGPGPAFLPVLLAVALGLLALGLLGRAFVGGPRAPAPGRGTPWLRGGGWRLVVIVLALAAYALLFERLGFLLSTALFLGFLLAAVGQQRWPVVLAVALGTAALAHLLFVRLLAIPLPRGILGF